MLCLHTYASNPFPFLKTKYVSTLLRTTTIALLLQTPKKQPKMVLKLYGSAMSTARVLVTILEKELPYEHVVVDIAKGDQKSEAYKKLQPFGKVPVFEDDGFFMFESRAICRYLAR